VNAGYQVFNYGRLRSSEMVARFNAAAALADVARVANDISFNVATYYLQVLAAKEQIKISQVQIAQSQNQFDITRKRVEAGVSPELNLAEVESQLATDSSNYYIAKGNYEQNLLALRALLNLETDVLFGIETPMVDQIPIESFAELQPETVYENAKLFHPQFKVDSLRILSARTNVKVAQAAFYPTLSLGANLSTNFSNSFKTNSGFVFQGYTPITGSEPIVTISSVNYYVQSPVYKVSQQSRSFTQLWDGWGRQMNNNFGQNVGFSLSVPIFNGFSARTNVRIAKLNQEAAELTRSQDDLTLRQNIYTAYTNAVTALQKFNAGRKTVESAQKAYDFALKRYEVGLLSSLDLITNQNNLLKSKVQQLNNQYDYIFKMKLLEFYKGRGLKL
jgi:outer membrane protein